MSVEVIPFFHQQSNTLTYLVVDENAQDCVVIDPVLDFDPVSGRTSDAPIEGAVRSVSERDLTLRWILETHAHADHVSGAPELKAQCGGEICIGSGIRNVEQAFGHLFRGDSSAPGVESHFDRLLDDGATLPLGQSTITVMATPGHTPSCVTYLIGDAAFVGDTLFMPDGGTARADFPGGDAAQLYASIRRILALDEATRIFVCHDYGPAGRDIAWETTVGDQRRDNIHVGGDKSAEDFVSLRTERDKTLSLPKLIVPSIQLNIRAGKLPEPDPNGVTYVRIPLNQL